MMLMRFIQTISHIGNLLFLLLYYKYHNGSILLLMDIFVSVLSYYG